jgi:hypothetical protein
MALNQITGNHFSALAASSNPTFNDSQKQRWVLQFNGDRYPLPPALTKVP